MEVAPFLGNFSERKISVRFAHFDLQQIINSLDMMKVFLLLKKLISKGEIFKVLVVVLSDCYQSSKNIGNLYSAVSYDHNIH